MLFYFFSTIKFRRKKKKAYRAKRLTIHSYRLYSRYKQKEVREYHKLLKRTLRRRYKQNRKFFLVLYFFLRSLLCFKKSILKVSNDKNFNLLPFSKKKLVLHLLKKSRLLSKRLLELKFKKRARYRRLLFKFSIISRELFFSSYRLHRIKKKPYEVVDWFMRGLRERGPAYYDLWNHYNRNKELYRYLRDLYRFSRFGLVFLSLILVFVLFLVLYVLPFINFILFCFFVAPVLSLNLFFETILPFLLQTADNLFFLFQEIFFFFKTIIKMIYSIQLLPEIIILLGIFLIICIQTWVLSYYNLRYFKKLIIASFGLERAQLFFEKNQMSSILSNRLSQIKQLFIVSTFWDISLCCLLISMFFLIFTGIDFVTNTDYASFLYLEKTNLLNGMNDKFFGSHFFYDSFTFYSRFFILLASIFFLIIFKSELTTDSKFQRIEFIILFLLGILFSMLMISASSLLSLFLIIEGLVAIMYVLTAGNFLEINYPVSVSLKFRSTEGSIKYLVTNAVAGSFFLIGSIFLLYSTKGEIYFTNLHIFLSLDHINSLPFFSQLGILLGLLCLAFTFLFKIGSFPFYSWMIDLYESANLGILSFFVLIPKMAILLTIINLQRFLFYHFPLVFFFIFLSCGILSLIAGAILALKQTKINRLVAYSSVSQIGSFLILLALTTLNINISYLLPMLFVISYSFVMLQFMAILIGLKRLPFFSSISVLQELAFIKNLPVSVQTIFATFIFNLAGVPPFLGWLLKSLVVFTSIFLTFNFFFDINNFDVYFLSTLSNFELSFLTFFKEHIFNIKTSFFSSNLSFSFFIFLSVIIFFALTVSVYYSLQLYKIIFFETKNISVVHSTKTPNYNTSLLLGSTIFFLFFFNIFLLITVLDVFSWTLFLCYF